MSMSIALPQPASSWVPALAFLALAALLLDWLTITFRNRRNHLPPGPKPLPLIGNVLDIPLNGLGQGWFAVSQRYGDVVYLNVLGQPMISLGSMKSARDLLDKRSGNYSARPPSVMSELVGYSKWAFAWMSYGPTWRRHRRAFHQAFNGDIIKECQPIQTQAAGSLVRAIRKSPKDLGHHMEFAFAATLMRVIYGIEVTETNDKYYGMVRTILDIGEDIIVPGRYLVEVFPLLRYLPSWFPGARFKRFAAQAGKESMGVIDELFRTARSAMESGVGKDSCATHLLANVNTDDPELEDTYTMCKGVMATAYVGGSDTTNAAMRAFCLAMSLYPDAQKKAQVEIDAAVGSQRMPDFSDRDSLPYVNAIIKEILRWHVVVPISFPHRSVVDDEYEGYFIPGGSIVFPNIWAISRDPAVYPDPEEFIPERFLDEHGCVDCKGKDPFEFVFGFGRRSCPGRDFSDASLFILCSTILWAFNIGPPVDEKGVPKEVDRTIITSGMLANVKATDFTIETRSSRVDAILSE